MFLLFRSAAATPFTFSFAIGDTNTMRGPVLPLNAFAFSPATYVLSFCRNSGNPDSPANDSLKPYAAKITSAFAMVRCCSTSAKFAGRGSVPN